MRQGNVDQPAVGKNFKAGPICVDDEPLLLSRSAGAGTARSPTRISRLPASWTIATPRTFSVNTLFVIGVEDSAQLDQLALDAGFRQSRRAQSCRFCSGSCAAQQPSVASTGDQVSLGPSGVFRSTKRERQRHPLVEGHALRFGLEPADLDATTVLWRGWVAEGLRGVEAAPAVARELGRLRGGRSCRRKVPTMYSLLPAVSTHFRLALFRHQPAVGRSQGTRKSRRCGSCESPSPSGWENSGTQWYACRSDST